MKKTMVTVLIVALLIGILAGCGRNDDEPANVSPDVTASPMPVQPEDDNGMVEDENGIIGENGNATDTDVPDEGILPEIGQGIEEGTNDVIDGVENGVDDITGNGNNNNTNNNNNSRNRTR